MSLYNSDTASATCSGIPYETKSFLNSLGFTSTYCIFFPNLSENIAATSFPVSVSGPVTVNTPSLFPFSVSSFAIKRAVSLTSTHAHPASPNGSLISLFSFIDGAKCVEKFCMKTLGLTIVCLSPDAFKYSSASPCHRKSLLGESTLAPITEYLTRYLTPSSFAASMKFFSNSNWFP